MIQRIATPAAFISLAVATPLILAGCTDKPDEDAIKVTSTKTECDLATSEAETGDVDFSVTNNDEYIELPTLAQRTRALVRFLCDWSDSSRT